MQKRILTLILSIALLLTFVPAVYGEQPATPTDLPPLEEDLSWDCPSCGATGNTGNFCTDCGAARPWDCPNCGATGNTGNFCPNCGSTRPNGEEPAEPIVVQVGDTITFGTWEQDNDQRNGAEPIEWIVLEIRGDRALVISRFGLVNAKYMNSANGQVWANSALRATLNYDFYNAAFTDAEKAAIAVTHLVESEDDWDPELRAYNRSGMADTDDRIFVLSYAETVRYFPTDESRKCYCTEYIRVHGNRSDRLYAEGRTCWYWLRSPAYANNASAVDWDGSIASGYMHHARGVARPCCWVSLSALGLRAPEAETEVAAEGTEAQTAETPAAAPDAPAARVGDLVTFGHYEQDNDADNGPEPIEWRVLEVDEESGRAMLVSRWCLDRQPYHTGSSRTTWAECTLRTWLNDTFLNAAFTPEEQEAVLLTQVDNSGRQNDPNFPFDTENTEDRVYLLSYAEVMRYMDSEPARFSAATDYAVSHGAFVADDRFMTEGRHATWWFLRSPGRSRSNVMVVPSTGSVYDTPFVNSTMSSVAVRPVIWVRLDALQTNTDP